MSDESKPVYRCGGKEVKIPSPDEQVFEEGLFAEFGRSARINPHCVCQVVPHSAGYLHLLLVQL